MKLHYYPETDSLYIEFREEPGVETREVSDGVNVDIDARGAWLASTSIARQTSLTCPRWKQPHCRSAPTGSGNRHAGETLAGVIPFSRAPQPPFIPWRTIASCSASSCLDGG